MGYLDVSNMRALFAECTSLEKIPDISNWKTQNVIDMNKMFLKCKKIERLPNISVWTTNKVTNMNKMFFGCESLLVLLYISNRNISHFFDISGMFGK